MESIKQWFQDWSDACEYANECAPDLSFLTPQEPYTALVALAAACGLLWWLNERSLRAQASAQAAQRAASDARELEPLIAPAPASETRLAKAA